MNWQAIGASVVGSGHLRRGVPCQDAHHIISNDDFVIAAVADGLGSAVRSHEGATLAVKSVSARLASILTSGTRPANDSEWSDVMRVSFGSARDVLFQAASSQQISPKDLATTLIVVAIGEGWMACAQIGDGAVTAHFHDRAIQVISAPQRGEYANETFPLTAPDALERMYCRSLFESPLATAIFTDGLQGLCMNESKNMAFEPFFTPLFTAVSRPLDASEAAGALVDFLSSERVCRRTDDDKTLVLIGKLDHSPISGALNTRSIA